MRRWQALAALAAGVMLTAGACGVQPTGVNIASTLPFDVSSTETSPSVSSPGMTEEIQIFLMPKNGSNSPHLVTRQVARKPAKATDLLEPLTEVTADDEQSGYATFVPPGVQLVPTKKNAHEYFLTGPTPSQTGLKQIACTFDLYWRNLSPPDGQRYSTRFILEDGSDWGWDDCSGYFGPDDSPNASEANAPGKVARTAASPSPNGN